MKKLLHREPQDWRSVGGLHTAEEINQQPAVWLELAASLGAQQARIDSFMGDWLSQPGHRVILTGAGSSAFVGEIVADTLNSTAAAQVRAVATTSLLTHPALYLEPDAPTLLLSFARSGNSPESVATVDLLRQFVRTPRFLNITCNAEGALAEGNAACADTLNLLMPAASCDRGFAMTSSFTCMLLAALAVLGDGAWATRLQRITTLAARAQVALQASDGRMFDLAQTPFERIVYLGSGPLEALAKEAALKVLELTSGRSLALANTALGFRHGPKSMLNKASLVLMFRSGEAVSRRYEQDLIDELMRDGIAARIVEIGGDVHDLPDAWLAPLWLLQAQEFALHKSAALGLTPDNPFPDGTVNRVVQGVTIYTHGAN